MHHVLFILSNCSISSSCSSQLNIDDTIRIDCLFIWYNDSDQFKMILMCTMCRVYTQDCRSILYVQLKTGTGIQVGLHYSDLFKLFLVSID